MTPGLCSQVGQHTRLESLKTPGPDPFNSLPYSALLPPLGWVIQGLFDISILRLTIINDCPAYFVTVKWADVCRSAFQFWKSFHSTRPHSSCSHNTPVGGWPADPHAWPRATSLWGCTTASHPFNLCPVRAHKLSYNSLLNRRTPDYFIPTGKPRECCRRHLCAPQTQEEVFLLIPLSSLLHLPQPLSSIRCHYCHAGFYTY